jgi:hypothetical protein
MVANATHIARAKATRLVGIRENTDTAATSAHEKAARRRLVAGQEVGLEAAGHGADLVEVAAVAVGAEVLL